MDALQLNDFFSLSSRSSLLYFPDLTYLFYFDVGFFVRVI